MLRQLCRRGFLSFLATAPVIAGYGGPSTGRPGRVPEAGMVPDEETAKAIASAVALAHFGAENLKLSLPWKAFSAGNDQLWIVMGKRIPDDQGLGLVVHISRMNGCITYLDRTR